MSDFEKLKSTFDEIGLRYCILKEFCEITKIHKFTYIEVNSYSGIDSLLYKFYDFGKFISID